MQESAVVLLFHWVILEEVHVGTCDYEDFSGVCRAVCVCREQPGASGSKGPRRAHARAHSLSVSSADCRKQSWQRASGDPEVSLQLSSLAELKRREASEQKLKDDNDEYEAKMNGTQRFISYFSIKIKSNLTL